MSDSQRLELAGGGNLVYLPQWLAMDEASQLLEELSTSLPWQQRTIKMFGKLIPEPRLSVWLGDSDAAYAYSGRVHQPQHWTPGLAALRGRLEELLKEPFNSVLANLYRHEQDSVGWHADDERELGESPTIASISLGETRRFWLKHPRADTVRLELDPGSLLVMQGTTQHHWKHSVPKETSHREPRINLTFRHIRHVVKESDSAKQP